MLRCCVCALPLVLSAGNFLFSCLFVYDLFPAFLEYINMILCSGEIPGLFAKDELEQVMEDTRVIAKKKNRNFEDTPENLYKFFINRVKENLHVVLCFSPVGEKFRVRSRKFPGLISGCTIDWFTPWPYDALHATAQRFLSDFEMACDEEVKANLVTYICSEFLLSVFIPIGPSVCPPCGLLCSTDCCFGDFVLCRCA